MRIIRISQTLRINSFYSHLQPLYFTLLHYLTDRTYIRSKTAISNMQNEQTTDRLTQGTGLEPIPTQATTAEQRALDQRKLDRIAEMEAFRQELASIRGTIESGIADFKKSCEAQPQAPTGAGLVKHKFRLQITNIRAKYSELKSGLKKSDTKKPSISLPVD